MTEADARLRLEETERQLRARREAEQGLAADVDAITADRERLNQNLVEMARAIQSSEGRLTTIEGRLGSLEAQEKFLRGSLAERHSSIVKLLASMQRMGRNPPPVMITRREDALTMVRSAMVLASAFPQIREQALTLAGELKELSRVIGETRAEGDKLKAETQRLGEQRLRLSGLLDEKRQSLSERQQALSRVRQEAAEIAKSVTNLNDLITRLDKVVTEQAMPPTAAPTPAVAAVPLPERRDDKVAALLLPPSLNAPTSQPASPPATPGAVVLAPAIGKKASYNPARIKPAIAFAQAKGRLPLPAQGKMIIKYGDKANASKSNGIVMETRAGAQITSPSDGWIVFAGVFRSYGQILIINAGDGYHILLAGLSQIDVQLGQFVLAGEPVGKMIGSGGGGKPKGSEAAPVLYVEFRKDGRSIDPDPWWLGNGT